MSAAPTAAVVTGGVQGIGLAIARALAAEGRRVALFGTRDVAAGRRVAASLGSNHVYVRCDISVEAQVEAAMSETRERIGPVDVLVNNAGVGSRADLAEMKEAEWDGFFAADLTGAWLCTKHALAHMRDVGGGSIVNISSFDADMTKVGMSPYAATRSGMLGLTRSLALELANTNIRVNTVCPRFVRTPPIEAPEEVAHVVAYLASPRASFVTGATWNCGLAARFAT